MASQWARVNPWLYTWSPSPQLKGWLLRRVTMSNCTGRGSSGSRQRLRQRQGVRLCRPVGRPRGSETSLLLSLPLQTLLLGHPYNVREDCELAGEGCFSDWEKHTCRHSQLSVFQCSQWAVCPAVCTAAAAAQVDSRNHKPIPGRTLAKSFWTQSFTLRPLTTSKQKPFLKFGFTKWSRIYSTSSFKCAQESTLPLTCCLCSIYCPSRKGNVRVMLLLSCLLKGCPF